MRSLYSGLVRCQRLSLGEREKDRGHCAAIDRGITIHACTALPSSLPSSPPAPPIRPRHLRPPLRSARQGNRSSVHARAGNRAPSHARMTAPATTRVTARRAALVAREGQAEALEPEVLRALAEARVPLVLVVPQGREERPGAVRARAWRARRATRRVVRERTRAASRRTAAGVRRPTIRACASILTRRLRRTVSRDVASLALNTPRVSPIRTCSSTPARRPPWPRSGRRSGALNACRLPIARLAASPPRSSDASSSSRLYVASGSLNGQRIAVMTDAGVPMLVATTSPVPLPTAVAVVCCGENATSVAQLRSCPESSP